MQDKKKGIHMGHCCPYINLAVAHFFRLALTLQLPPK